MPCSLISDLESNLYTGRSASAGTLAASVGPKPQAEVRGNRLCTNEQSVSAAQVEV